MKRQTDWLKVLQVIDKIKKCLPWRYVSVFETGNLLRGVPEVDECDSPRSVTRRKRHVAHNLDRFGPRGA
jgi:hypothetical protein